MCPCRLLGLLLLYACASGEARSLRRTGILLNGPCSSSSSSALTRPAFLGPYGCVDGPKLQRCFSPAPSQRGGRHLTGGAAAKGLALFFSPAAAVAENPAPLAAACTALLYGGCSNARRVAFGILSCRPFTSVERSGSGSASGHSCLSSLPFRGRGRGDGFTWEETSEQIRLQVYLDSSVKASDVLFFLEGRRLTVSIKGHAPLLQGTLKGRVDTSECIWFLEPYTTPEQQEQQQEQQPAAKQLTIELKKHPGSGGSSVAAGMGAHWGCVFEETSAAEAANVAYNPVSDSGGGQASRVSYSRVSGAILAELAVPASLMGVLPPPPTEESDPWQEKQREQYVLKQGLAFLDVWAHARDNQTLKPFPMRPQQCHGKTSCTPHGVGRHEDFGCPETLVHVHVEPLPDGVFLVFMEPEEANSSSKGKRQQLQQHAQWPENEGIELRLTFSHVPPMSPQQQQQELLLHIVALRRSAGSAALHAFGPWVHRLLHETEQRIIQKLQQDLVAASSGDGGIEAKPGETLQQQHQHGSALEKLIRMEQQRLNPPPSARQQHDPPNAEGSPDDGVRVLHASPSLGPAQSKSSGHGKASVEAPPGAQQISHQHLQAPNSTEKTAHEGSPAERERGTFRHAPPVLVGSEDAASTREKMGIKLLDLSDKTTPVPSFMINWSPERRRAFQEDTANGAMKRLKEAAAPALQLHFTDIEFLLRQQLNCTQEEFREAWQGGYDRCERQELQQPHRRLPGEGGVGAGQQQASVFYVQQLEERINSAGRPQVDTHEAALKAAEEAANDPAAAESLAAEGDDTQDAGLKRREYFVDPFAGPSSELAPPEQMHDAPAVEEVPRHRRYLLMDEEERAKMRMEVQEDMSRFELLLSELETQKDRNAWLLICEQYKDLLMGESYFLLLTIRLRETPPVARSAPLASGRFLRSSAEAPGAEPKSAERGSAAWATEERERLRFVNRFVLSLYEDLGALLQANEATQIKKIKLLCMQAIQDISKLNEYAESMKPLFDRDFFAYLLTAIQEERRRIAKQGLNPEAAPSQWLLVLLVIQKGVTALFEKGIREDVMDLGFILIQQQPEVRRKLLELWIAKLPKCDWRQFKLLGLRLAKRFNSGAYSHSAVSAYPWLPAAARQLGHDLEQILPEWLIDNVLSDFDRHIMQTQLAERPFLFGSVEPPKPPPEDSPEALCANMGKLIKEQTEEAARAFQNEPRIHEQTGEAISAAH